MIAGKRGREEPGSAGRGSGGEGGYALAISLIVIVVVTILAAAGWSMADVELGASRDFHAATEAFYVADRGLNRYLATHAADLDTTVTYQVGTGTATVTPESITRGMANNEELYRVTSTGVYVAPDGETVTRSVSTVLLATPLLPVHPTGAFVAGGTFHQNGASPTYDGDNGYTGGDDLCEAADVQSGGSVPGVVADTFEASGGGTSNGGRCDSHSGVDPDADCRDDPVDEFMSADQWEYMLNELPADHTISGSDDFPQTDGWEVVRADGDYLRDSGATSGEGILIVEGNYTSDGDFDWDGLILVGGKFVSNGTEDIDGGFAVGLNELLGMNVPETTVGNGSKNFTFNACNVFKASRSKFRVSQVPSGWYEQR